MSAPPLQWRCCNWQDIDRGTLYELLRLRSAVFVVEQQCLYQDMDGLDPHCAHVLGIVDTGLPLACARLVPPGMKYPEASIGRVVIAPAVRGLGLGRVLLREALSACEQRWPGQALALGAQLHLEAFYASLGFARIGAPYDEDGIPHVDMRRPGR